MQAGEIEKSILSRSLPELPSGEGWVLPHYEGLSIANLPATISALLGHSPEQVLPQALPTLPEELWHDWLPGLRRVVLVVVDAMGYRLLQRMWAEGEGQPMAGLAEAGRVVPLTSVFPSTTDAALVSLRTGVAPATHGWLAYFMYLREFGALANAILLCPAQVRDPGMLVAWGLDPETMIPQPSLQARLSAFGVTTRAVLSSYLAYSAFTQMLYQGVGKICTHRHASDFWGHLRHLLAKTRGKPALITGYWSGIDTLAHAYGPETDLSDGEFRTVNYLLEREFLSALPAQDRKGTLLLIAADHGQIYVPPKGIVTVNRDPELERLLMVPISGESRAAFVYPRPGQADAIRQHLERAYPGWFTILDSRQALELGLLGKPVNDETYARAGELLVLPRGSHALQHTIPKVSLLGRHGGLTAEEMLVPLIGSRLDGW
jgi:hypothetical protein